AMEGLLGNNSFLTASVLTPLIDPVTLTTQNNNLDITSTSDKDYFLVTAPLGASQLTVNVQSSGLSLLRPDVTVYAADMTTVLGSATGSGYTGGTLSVTLNNVSPLQAFYVKVGGADTTAFGTGRYALTVGLGASALPSVTLPNTLLANGDIFS